MQKTTFFLQNSNIFLHKIDLQYSNCILYIRFYGNLKRGLFLIKMLSKNGEKLTKKTLFPRKCRCQQKFKVCINCHSVPILVYYNRGKFHVCTMNIIKVIECSIFPRDRFLKYQNLQGVQFEEL